MNVDGDIITVAEGTMKRTQAVVIPAYASGRIEVRFPACSPAT